MIKRKVTPLALLLILVASLLVAPVAGGLTITDGEKIITRTGNTSPVISITDSAIAANGTITIDVSPLDGIVAKGSLINTNIVVDDTAASATWTGMISGDTLTLTSSGGPTGTGENVTVTFTGAVGSPWIPDTQGGVLSGSLTATRTDTSETSAINFSIETALGPGGLTVAPGTKITTTDGATLMEITIIDAPLGQYDYIIMDVSQLDQFVSGGALKDANIIINDTAASATWTGKLESSTLTLTPTGDPTIVGETVTITFTGAEGSTWIRNTFGERTVTLNPNRMDNYGTTDFNFVIEITPPPGGLTITDGAKISTVLGATSPVITIADTNIPAEDTITMDVSGLAAYVASGTLTEGNVGVTDTAAAANWTRELAGNILTLTSSGGTTVIGENVTVTYTGSGGNAWIPNTHGEQMVPLTASRTDTAQTGTFNVVIETAPPAGFLVDANFTATPTTDMAPLTVNFTDTSLGSPTTWIWDLGDGNSSTLKNPVHTYAEIGTYTVTLTATNAYGSDTKTEWNYINVLNGVIREADTAIAGLTITNCRGPQAVTVDPSILPAALIPNNSVLELQPPADSGFKHIIIYAMKGTGFSRQGNLIVGKPTGVYLESAEMAPSSGFSGIIGTNSSFYYSVNLSSYPCNAKLVTKIWEGAIPEYEVKLNKITSGNGAVSIGTAYTAKITKTNFPQGARAKVYMSVSSFWNQYLSGGPGNVYIWRIADDGNSGQVLPTTYLYNNTVDNLDYFAADSPLGLSTFGISSLTGSNNPFQMISFVAAQAINSATGGGSGKAVVVQTTSAPEIKSSVTPDPGKTAKIYTNADGVISQQTTLTSNDGFANISLGLGVVAKDGSGKPLSSISITRVADGNLPSGSPGADMSFTGLAYEIQPDGVTFSPSVPVSLTIPQAKWGQEYVMHEYDHTTGIWKALESSYDPTTGVITTHISHLCCFALFAKTPAVENAVNPTPTTTIIVSSKSSMETNVQLYTWVLSSIRQNPVILIILVAVIGVVAYFGWWKRRL